MKCCASTYSFGQYAKDDKLGIFGIIDEAKKMGYEGIEIVDGTFSDCHDADKIKKIVEYCKENGMQIPSFCTGADFIYGSNGDIEAEINRVCGLVDIAAMYGVQTFRHDTARGYKDEKHSRGFDNALPRIVYACRKISEYAEGKGIVTVTENHGYFAQDAYRVEKIINGVAYGNFGALVDIGNFMCADEDPVKSVSIMAPYARMVHAKDFFKKSGMDIDPGEGWFRTRAGDYLRGAVVGQGDAHAAQSLYLIKKSGYDGWISIEFEGMEDNLKGLRIGLANVKRFWESC